mgnify:CR=1 FL=1
MYYNARYVICQRLNFSKEEHALSYNACFSLENELNPETNFAAFSLKIANNTPIIRNGITKIIHDQNPIFIINTSASNFDLYFCLFSFLSNEVRPVYLVKRYIFSFLINA